MTARIGDVLCVCGHLEPRRARVRCSACSRSYRARVTPDRLAAVRAVEAKILAAIAHAPPRPIDDLIARSSVGEGLRRIREHGIDAEVERLHEEMHGAKGIRS